MSQLWASVISIAITGSRCRRCKVRHTTNNALLVEAIIHYKTGVLGRPALLRSPHQALLAWGHAQPCGGMHNPGRIVHFCRCATPVAIRRLKSVLDLLKKGEGYPSSALLVRHAQIRQSVVHSIVENIPVFAECTGHVGIVTTLGRLVLSLCRRKTILRSLVFRSFDGGNRGVVYCAAITTINSINCAGFNSASPKHGTITMSACGGRRRRRGQLAHPSTKNGTPHADVQSPAIASMPQNVVLLLNRPQTLSVYLKQRHIATEVNTKKTACILRHFPHNAVNLCYTAL